MDLKPQKYSYSFNFYEPQRCVKDSLIDQKGIKLASFLSYLSEWGWKSYFPCYKPAHLAIMLSIWLVISKQSPPCHYGKIAQKYSFKEKQNLFSKKRDQF